MSAPFVVAPDMKSHVRDTDPATSRAAAKLPRNTIRWGSQRHSLLIAFGSSTDMTDEEAGKMAGLYEVHSCYWKRCGELRQLGLIEDTGTVRKSSCGCDVIVSRITKPGRKFLFELATGK